MGALQNNQLDQFSIQHRQLSILQNVLQGRNHQAWTHEFFWLTGPQSISETSLLIVSLYFNFPLSSSAEDRLVASYKRSFNGFAAFLTEEEQQKIARMEGVLSVFPSKTYQLHSTRSWDFVGLSELVKREIEKESDVIIGFLDSGIWPESESFSDEGFGPPPRKWKGICQTDGNFTCNNKVIGARYYKGPGKDITSARDTGGHGTHTASTAAGRRVKGTSFFGIAHGSARGAVPSARIAMYKVCGEMRCSDSSILAGFDDAIADGVDILSASLGFMSAKNYSSTVSSVAPWVISVAASSIDRQIVTKAIVGDKVFRGRSINSFGSTKSVPLILSTNASISCDSANAGTCLAECLDKKLVKGKIIFCEEISSGDGALLSGALGQIMQTEEANDYSRIFPLPSTVVDMAQGDNIKSYIKRTKNPQAKILKSVALRDRTAPVVVSFSSRGPNPISSNILKPDITAPGVEIIAAYSPAASLTRIKQDKRSTKYAILSGTSMSCPHVSGAAAYVKAFHPDWSPAAIKSALMTTAFPINPRKNVDMEFAYGAGQINPVKAVNPGLVYDANKDDYIQFLCNEGYTAEEIRLISGAKFKCRKTNGTVGDLNYPSIQLLVDKNRTFSRNFSRSVTNVGTPVSTYKAVVKQLPGLKIAVSPSVLSFKSVNEKHSFVVTVGGEVLSNANVTSTSLVWSDGVHSVRSPIVVYTDTA
ncbi:subtilisin-like protein protease SBT4.3 isoform X1 [Cinnamomum micranthum f. kanehirae]|uniref:Subtilisin-like protein protease SBT4.3 isoform X1 n=1 Tax=Cinnamomum micranthum f. kanehirae TaxID=337451 RepID=A0A3S3MA63_9MAGN|nr:subtilisin-like protein protease SBT4.3 isoform X1 [Cinnamomum micranthum f. kanehirae]